MSRGGNVCNLGGSLSTTVTPIAGTNWFLGTGRRKESIARVFLRAGSGKFTINKRPVENSSPNFAWKHDAIEPLKFTSLADQVDVVVTARGGGVGGQAGAVRMGLSRAIAKFNPELRASLRTNGFLTRDSRMKERKKYGQKGARQRLQFTRRYFCDAPRGVHELRLGLPGRDHGRQAAGKKAAP